MSSRATRIASYYTHRATCTKAQATHRRGPRLWANRRLRRFRSGAVEKMTGDHRRNTDPMLSSLRSGAKTRSGKPCGVSGGKRRKALPNAWWCAGIRGSPRQQVRAEARPLYARSDRGTPAIGLMRQSRRLALKPSCRCLRREGRVRCPVVSIVARGSQVAGSNRAGLVEQPTLV
jgi:hypothetical protein